MAISQADIASGSAGLSIGVVVSEGLQQGVEAERISPTTAQMTAAGIGATGLGLVAADATGVVGLPGEAAAFAGGAGVGSTSWLAARAAGVAPRITVEIPEEVNLARPLVTAVVGTVVGIAAGTALGAARGGTTVL